MSIDMTPTDFDANAGSSYLTGSSGTGTVSEGDSSLMREAMTADPAKGKGADPKASGRTASEEEAAESKSAKSAKSQKSAKSSKGSASLPDFDPLADINIMQL